MILPFSDELEIGFLSKIFDKKNESYKLFWFQAIVNKVMSGKNCLTYDEIINEMIADSWYMVTEYKLNLGPSDTMEALIRYIFENNNIKSNEKNEEIISFLEQCEDKRVKDMKRTLTNEVPYRLQKPFIKQIEKDVWNGPKKVLVEQINRKKRLIYYFNELSGIKTSIIVQQEWIDYIKKNENIIKGWIQYNLIIYLQKRNPNVPGIADKLNPPRSRKLNKVIKYWKTILDITPVYEIFAHEELNKKNLSIDHFVPWSYVAHDEFWNLHPTTKISTAVKIIIYRIGNYIFRNYVKKNIFLTV